MATNKNNQPVKRKPSKRERRMKIIVYVMVILMILSTFTYGLAMFI
ncbi:stressosome-associated protein Prli42 [Aquibacillus salsiterrae]|uniref:Stressosome-associated protein Prli42 n=1 Tax=Aquibacillus salsiterrae TaxID=2950439 RepID=A0A9X4ADJ3_9BACI|nr:stressosome-associated protein Prli42 [Aquibacillus salsiterrae]MDC3415451.1 stressosome-associated protein Prli42 [Aquibacillus salsiterrae]